MEVSNDDAILNFIFNPAAGLTTAPPSLPSKPIDETLLRAKKLEIKAIRLADQGKDIRKALELLTQAIELVPDYASPFNNRAQVHRLNQDFDAALRDLNKAIELCSFLFSEIETSSSTSLSSCTASGSGSSISTIALPQQDREKTRGVLKQALAQRASVKKHKGEDESANKDLELLRKVSLVDNYYAKLCNQTVAEVLANYYQNPDTSLTS